MRRAIWIRASTLVVSGWSPLALPAPFASAHRRCAFGSNLRDAASPLLRMRALQFSELASSSS